MHGGDEVLQLLSEMASGEPVDKENGIHQGGETGRRNREEKQGGRSQEKE